MSLALRTIIVAAMQHSASIDPELREWLQWVSESDEVSIFIRVIAKAAFLAATTDYAMLRPVLLELKRQREGQANHA